MKSTFHFTKILFLDFKKIVIYVFFSIIVILFSLIITSYFEKRQSVIEKFTMGIVIEDENKYLDTLLNMALKRDDFNKILEFKIITKNEAEEKFSKKELVSYIIIPKDFTQSIISGQNKDIIFVGNPDFKISYQVSEILLKTGIAFLTSSQSGIYGTIDFAVKNGIDYETINKNIVMPINIEFGKSLLSYKNYFVEKEIYPSGSLPIKIHYIISFSIFFITILGINFYSSINMIISNPISERMQILGLNKIKVLIKLFFSIFLILIFISLFFCFYIGIIKTILLTINISMLILFSSIFFKDKTSNSIFIFSISILMLFFSGGVLPKGILPDFINKLSYLTINHYFITKNNYLYTSLFTSIFVLILFVLSYTIFQKRSL